MHIGLSLEGRVTEGAWRLGDIQRAVRAAEKAGFDFVVLPDETAAAGQAGSWPEATTTLAWLAASTDRIGLVSQASTVRHEPYNLARRFASLDQISHGRIGWLAPLEADRADFENFSGALRLGEADFDERAAEFIAIVHALWRGWDADALVLDREGGRFFDPAKMHHLDHAGPHFSVRGPLNVARSPQGAPVIFSGTAGGSIAAKADVIIVDAETRPSADGARTLRRIDLSKASTPVDAHRLETIATEDGLDGFLFVASSPDAAEFATGQLAADLRGRNLLRETYAGATLRDHLGLAQKGAAR
ncbi:LLM class flavin-dependent oxidoreductase [Mesorhizobium sp. CAU 1732]|uniref:LLM class flavin-dependent oxidoreductase n=1 Tax=Mesorhizobium sp. CAU 1732 TaxID=3140358 RepID=UPI003260E020